MTRLSDENIAWLLDSYPGWSPVFADLTATIDGVIVVIGFQTSKETKTCILRVEDVGTFLRAYPRRV